MLREVQGPDLWPSAPGLDDALPGAVDRSVVDDHGVHDPAALGQATTPGQGVANPSFRVVRDDDEGHRQGEGAARHVSDSMTISFRFQSGI